MGLFAATVAFVLPIAYSPNVNSPFWSPRLAIVLLLSAVGIPRLVPLILRHDRAAAFASAFLGVAGLSALVARQPSMALFGPYGFGAGLVMVAGMAGAWAIGRSLDQQGRDDVQRGILAAVLVNVVVALAQEALDLRSLGLSPVRGAYGLLGNPVHLGALLAGGSAIIAARFLDRPGRWASAAVAVGAALQLSGSRFGLLALVAVTGCVVGRRPRAPSAAFMGCLTVGFLGALVLGPLLTEHTDSPTVVQKLQSASEGELYNRAQNWRSGLHALADRPALGYGPGRFVEATSPRRTARMASGDPETVFLDAHNLFVEYAVTTGPLGLVTLSGFLLLALRRARGPLLWCAVGILALHIMQPQSFGTTPLAFLALGAAGPLHGTRRRRLALLPATGVLVFLALLGAGRLVVGDFRLDQANLDFSIAQGRAAADDLSPWPEPVSKLGQILFFRASMEANAAHRQELQRQSLSRLAEAVDRDPAIATNWNNLGDVELVLGREDGARRAFEQALERNPWSARALTALAAIAVRHGDEATARPLIARAEQVLSPEVVAALVAERSG